MSLAEKKYHDLEGKQKKEKLQKQKDIPWDRLHASQNVKTVFLLNDNSPEIPKTWNELKAHYYDAKDSEVFFSPFV